ncbi:uncharacterized protein LOC135690742 [Rhopilema esculentum]|uniref:uncharacterized protein LOC135690742 n=1 Tax=Rhopilema esculentum TaxID=499914 RepID=UPI0031D6711D
MTVEQQNKTEKEVIDMMAQFKVILGFANYMSLEQLEYLAKKKFTDNQKQLLERIKANATRVEICFNKSVRYFCHKHFPECKVYSRGKEYYTMKTRLCREACIDIANSCADELMFVPIFDRENANFFKLNCELLPKRSTASTESCVDPRAPDKVTTTTPTFTPRTRTRTTEISSKTSKSLTTSPNKSSLQTSTKPSTERTKSPTTSLPPTTKQKSSSTRQRKPSTASEALSTSTKPDPKTKPRTKLKTTQKTNTKIKTKHIPKTDPQTKKTRTSSPAGSHKITITTITDRQTKKKQIRDQGKHSHAENRSWLQLHKKTVIYSSSAAGLCIIIIITVVLIFLKKRSRTPPNTQHIDIDEQESPYYVRRFDCPEEIRKLMQDLQVEDSGNDREANTPPPLPDFSLRAAADNIFLMSNIYEKID